MNRVESKGWAGGRLSRSLDLQLDPILPARATSRSPEKRLPPKRARDQICVLDSPGLLPRLKQRLNHKRGSRDQVTLDQRAGNSQDAKASLAQLPVPRGVVRPLALVALVPVNLDNKRGLTREEVDDVIANDDLTPKLDAEQASPAHQAPHERLGVSGIATKHPSALFEECFTGGTLS
jgi:hypothetical protein